MTLYALGLALVLVPAPRTTVLAGPPATTTTTISYSENPAILGDTVTITVTVKAGASPVTGVGTLRVESCDTSDVLAAGTPDANGQITFDLDTTAYGVGTFLFKGHFIPNNDDQGTFKQSHSPCVGLEIIEQCTDPIRIEADLAGGEGEPCPGSTNSWNVEIVVTACGQDITGLTAQGGVDAWISGSTPGTPDHGSVVVRKANRNNQNKVYLWTIGDLADGESAHLTIAISGKVAKTDLTTQGLIGGWSATGTLADASVFRTDHTPKVYIMTNSATCAP